ncbi:hypothetical protein STEG23_026443, partial [Scotinomys teguina]
YSDRKFSRAETGDSSLYYSMMEIFLKEHHNPCAPIQCSPGKQEKKREGRDASLPPKKQQGSRL